MNASPSLRRVLLLTVPLALVLAGCNLGQGQSVAGPDTGDTGLAVGEQALVGQPASIHCTSEQLEAVAPCQGEDVGSVCTPADEVIIGPTTGPWSAPPAPEFKWTYPCIPDWYHVRMIVKTLEGDSLWAEETLGRDDPSDLLARSWSPGFPLHYAMSRYTYSVAAYIYDDSYFGGVGPHSYGETHFWTGPICDDFPGMSGTRVPVLLEPVDDAVYLAQEESTEGFVPLVWDIEMDFYGCLAKFEGQVSTDETFTTGIMPIMSGSPVARTGVPGGAVEWCHTYYWRVRAYTDAQVGPWSETHSFNIVPPGGESECGILHASVEAVATQNATCRLGPGTAYGISSYVPAGESHPVEGRNADGTWLKLQDLGCYIYRGLLALEVGGTPFPGGADVSDLMSVLPDPPLPTETPLPVCKSTMGPDDCVRYGGAWKQSFAGGPSSCACP